MAPGFEKQFGRGAVETNDENLWLFFAAKQFF
jgi:hypothetical protein